MSRIMLCGYYGFDNLGDTALLYSIITAIRQFIPEAQMVVMSNRPAQTAEQYGVQAVNRWHLPLVWREMKHCDVLVMGGGSLLQDVTGLKSLLYYLGVIRMAQLRGVPVFFYAQGIGPIQTASGRLLTRRVVNRVRYITVRDRDSARELRKLGITRPPVELCSDPVLGLSISEEQINEQRANLYRQGVTPGQPLVGVSVRHWENWERIRREVARAADRLANRGCSLVFIPMQPPQDTQASREVAALMSRKPVILENVGEVSDIAGVIATCDLVIGMRLHALILAAAAGVPLSGISYDPKVDAFLKQMGQTPATSARSPRADEILAQTEDILDHLPRARQQLEAAVAPLRQQAYLPTTLLSTLL